MGPLSRPIVPGRWVCPLYQGYGLTEVPTVVSFEPAGGAHIEGPSGVPLPHLEVRICDEAGGDLPAGQEGAVVVRGAGGRPWAGAYTPMLGYWRDGQVEP